MALVNAKNGLAVAAAALALGQAAAQGINALRAKAQSKGLADIISPDLAKLQDQLDKSQASIVNLQGQLTLMGDELTNANKKRIRWSIASFCLGLIPFTLKMTGVM